MPEAVSLPDVSTLAAPLYLAAIALEIVLLRFLRARGDYEAGDTVASLLMGLGSVISAGLIGGALYGLLFVAYEFRFATLGHSLPAIASCFVLNDLRYYWEHRIGHRSRWFWASHVVHHSSQHYNFSTALRQPWSGPIHLLIVLKLPLAFLGFHPGVIAFTASLNLVYQFWIHTEAIRKLPRWFEAVFNTPSHHRVHHGSNPRYLDANYAGTLIVWDRLFGTFVPECDADPVRFGIVKNLGTRNPLRIAFHEYVAIARDVLAPGLRWRERMGYAIAPPGWSHDGSRSTADELRAAYVARHPEAAGTPGFEALPQPAFAPDPARAEA